MGWEPPVVTLELLELIAVDFSLQSFDVISTILEIFAVRELLLELLLELRPRRQRQSVCKL